MEASLIQRAANFSKKAHGAQVRKYTGVPYYEHCHEVATLVCSVGLPEAVVAAAYLHDVIEDTEYTFIDLLEEFGEEVATLVWEVTDQSRPWMGNRAKRKAFDREHLATASPNGKSIKLADLISNTRDIVKNDKDFAVVYLKEKVLLLPLLRGGNSILFASARDVAAEANEALSIQRGKRSTSTDAALEVCAVLA